MSRMAGSPSCSLTSDMRPYTWSTSRSWQRRQVSLAIAISSPWPRPPARDTSRPWPPGCRSATGPTAGAAATGEPSGSRDTSMAWSSRAATMRRVDVVRQEVVADVRDPLAIDGEADARLVHEVALELRRIVPAALVERLQDLAIGARSSGLPSVPIRTRRPSSSVNSMVVSVTVLPSIMGTSPQVHRSPPGDPDHDHC